MDEFRAMKEADLAAEGKWRRRNWLGTGDSDAMKRPMKTAWRRWFERPTWLAFTVLPLAANGCGTIASINQNEPFPNIVYGGVQKAWGPHTALDVPFSAVADTVVLPYTIPRSIYNNARPDERPKYDVLGDRIWEPGTHGL